MNERQKTYVDERLRGKGTAKRKTSKLITDGDSTIRGSITSQEFPSQGFKRGI